MDTIITKSSSYIDLNIPVTEELSPYDAAYPMKFFANRLKIKLRQAETAVEEIYHTVLTELPILAQMEQATPNKI